MEKPSSNEIDDLDSVSLYTACNSMVLEQKENGYRALWQYLYRVALQMIYDFPDSEALAQDSAQKALIRIHKKIADCKDPQSFRAWSKRITVNLVIDELRRRKRLLPLSDETEGYSTLKSEDSTVEAAIESVTLADLRQLLDLAPISQRSRRVVLGRYFDDIPDELLAQLESQQIEKVVQPSHIQVTRAKNIAKLRDWDQLATYFD